MFAMSRLSDLNDLILKNSFDIGQTWKRVIKCKIGGKYVTYTDTQVYFRSIKGRKLRDIYEVKGWPSIIYFCNIVIWENTSVDHL